MSLQSQDVTCGTCGGPVFDLGSEIDQRVPCPECGSLTRHFVRVISEHLGGAQESDSELESTRELVIELRAQVKELEILARKDDLTELANRRGIERALVETVGGTDAPLAVLMVDIDHFKKVNDEHGHAAGDLVLKAAALRLRQALRGTGEVGRWGGEEFLIVVPDAECDLAQATAEAVCEGFRREQFKISQEVVIPVTVSVGIACSPAHGRTASELRRVADRSLYISKANGRDQWTHDPHPV